MNIVSVQSCDAYRILISTLCLSISECSWQLALLATTVKPVLRYRCQERPPVSKGHILWLKVTHINATEHVTKDHLS